MVLIAFFTSHRTSHNKLPLSSAVTVDNPYKLLYYVPSSVWTNKVKHPQSTFSIRYAIFLPSNIDNRKCNLSRVFISSHAKPKRNIPSRGSKANLAIAWKAPQRRLTTS